MVRFTVFLVVVALGVASQTTVSAQRSSKSRQRRTPRPVVTNPPIAPPADPAPAGEARVVSTADQEPQDPEDPEAAGTPRRSVTRKKASAAEPEQMQDTINSLSNQVERLNDKLSEMQENDKTLLDMERLTRAEQRAESLRSQQVEVESKLADLQARLEQIEYSLKPENIERATQGFGTVHPEEARDSRRRQLENEKARVVAQIRILETSRIRLDAALVTADAEVDRLRRRLELREQQENVTTIEAESARPRTRRPQRETP